MPPQPKQSFLEIERKPILILSEKLKWFFGPRFDTFNLVLKLLSEKKISVNILETGCCRKTNEAIDGNSTILWSRLVDLVGGRVKTIDSDETAMEVCRKFTGNNPKIDYIVSDSVDYLRSITESETKELDLIYFDSLDINPNCPKISPAHHMLELMSIWPNLSDDTILFFDDCFVERWGGTFNKAEYIAPFLISQGWKMLTAPTSYQWIFVKNEKTS